MELLTPAFGFWFWGALLFIILFVLSFFIMRPYINRTKPDGFKLSLIVVGMLVFIMFVALGIITLFAFILLYTGNAK